jgi:tRNA (guanine26-N2/guanine27-N2)-dimethyltransferase
LISNNNRILVVAVAEKDIVETREGSTRLLIPALSLTENIPLKVPAFFNPSAKLSRDVSILAYRAFLEDTTSKKKTFGDSFSGTGARALRVAVEVPEMEEVYMNDINPLAIGLSRKASELNFVTRKCNFSVNEVCKFLITHPTRDEQRFGVVDLDPFGSPAQYVDCLLRSVLDSGLISVTATDTAVLCGVYHDVCFRKYYGRPINNHYANETAIRLVLSLIALTAARLELSIHPLFVHSYLHYIRIYVKVKLSSSRASNVYDDLGYLRHCFKCGNRELIKEYDRSEVCDMCRNSFRLGGQLWISKLFDKNFIKRMANYNLKTSNNGNYDHMNKLLSICLDESDDIPYYFLVDEIASKLKTSPLPVQKVIEKLSAVGYRASKVSLNARAFKTNARINEILNHLR